MAKARVELICDECGRTYTREKFCHNRREADEWERWMEGRGGLCPECYTAKKLLDRADKDAAFEAGHNYPALIGSEKQVAWATTIRRKAITAIEEWDNGELAKIPEDRQDDPVMHVKAAGIAEFIAWVGCHEAASWWIDHRFDLDRDGLQIAEKFYPIWPGKEAFESRLAALEVTPHA